MKKRLALILFILLTITPIIGITRDNIIENAKEYLNISQWSPVVDSANIPLVSTTQLPPAENSGDTWSQDFNGSNETFESPYKTSANGGFSFGYLERSVSGPPYPIVAYVYGGDDNVDTFISRIDSGDSPGGRGTSAYHKKVYIWKSETNQYEFGWEYYYAKEYLAGIDCSSYVSYCWEVSRRSTTQLADIASIDNSAIDKQKVKSGY